MKVSTYAQCVLERKGEKQIAWIPAQFAVTNTFIQIKTKEGWQDGWKVVAVYRIRMDEETLMVRSQDYKNTRKASDI